MQHKQASIRLDIYHDHGHATSHNLTSKHKTPIFFSDVLLRNEERVKALHSRLVNKSSSSSLVASKKAGVPLKLKSISIPLNPAFSIGSGNYYVKIGLGTPTKYYTMILDTGSSFCWLQCRPCISCHTQIDPLFDPSKSKTYKTLSCHTSQCSSVKDATFNNPSCDAKSSNACEYTASYSDTSQSQGYLSQDLLTLTPFQTLPGFVYGCGKNNLGMFGTSDGIIGLAQHQLSMLSQLSPKYGSVFSYCLPTVSSGRGGFLSIGNLSLAMPNISTAYKFTPMFSDSAAPNLYFLRLTAITVAGRRLEVSPASYRVPTVMDTGTIITRLPESVYTALREAFVNVMSKRYAQAPAYSILDACFKGSLHNMPVVPEIQMIFRGAANLTLKTPNVLIDGVKGITCLAFASSGSTTNQIAIIGNHQQQTFSVAYDVSNSRIGFAADGCH